MLGVSNVARVHIYTVSRCCCCFFVVVLSRARPLDNPHSAGCHLGPVIKRGPYSSCKKRRTIFFLFYYKDAGRTWFWYLIFPIDWFAHADDLHWSILAQQAPGWLYHWKKKIHVCISLWPLVIIRGWKNWICRHQPMWVFFSSFNHKNSWRF